MSGSKQPFFYLRPIDTINEFAIDNLLRSMKIRHDKVANSGEFFKPIYFSYDPEKRYIGIFSESFQMYLYPPSKDRDYWILRTIEVKKDDKD